jgi:thiosulfate/3-mercaptopyruvate sulfurtransferase
MDRSWEGEVEAKQRVVVDAGWLRDRIDDPGLVIVDAREPYFYAQGHVPGAVSLPVMTLRPSGGAAPPAHVMARALGSLGIDRESKVVLYDGGAGTAAATLYWLLDVIGHPFAAILDGGVTAWHRDGLEIDYLPISAESVSYVVDRENQPAAAILEDVLEAIGDPDSVILDVRSPAEYLGLQPTAERNGHIPGAVNVDWTSTFRRDADGVARLKSADELRLLYETAGVLPGKQVMLYCHSGVRSAVTYVVLKNIGFTRVRNYGASWEEWGNRPDTPIEET